MKSISNLRVIILLILSILLLIVSSVLLSFDTEIAFSYESGFYEAPLQLQISCNVEGAAIYYTTDGSVPDTTDHLYTGALPLSYTTDVPNRLSARTDIVPDGAYPPDENVMKAHVIRAVAITPWGGRSQVLNGTFFIGYDREMEFGEVPIFSLMIEDEYLFDYETGIYVNGKTYDDWNAGLIESLYPWILPANYTNRGEAWERPITVEYLPFGDAPGFVQDMGLRIKGGYSRTFEQKSLRLTARAEYGAKALDYPVFPDNVRLDGKGYVEKYKSIVLRNGGNDFHYAAIRDPLIQRLSTGMRFITQSSLPCIVFINGEYWGGYALTEHYSDNFIENNYGIDNSNVVTYKSFLMKLQRNKSTS